MKTITWTDGKLLLVFLMALPCFGQAPVIGAPTTTITTVVYPSPGTGTISAAIAAHPGGNLSIILGCGTYRDNVTITSSYNFIQGNQQCTIVQPAAAGAVFAVQPASNGAGLYYNWFLNFSMTNPSAYSSDGIDFLDASTTNPHNDYNLVQGVYTNGFVHAVKIQGGNQWNTLSNDVFNSSTGNGIDITSPTGEPITNLRISDRTIVTNSSGYGIYALVSELDNWEISNADIERNGASVTANCAGIYISPTVGRTVNITGGYYEGNCPNSQTNNDATAATIRLTTPNTTSSFYNANVSGVYFSQAGNNAASGCGILDDAVATSTNAGSGNFYNNEFALVSSVCGSDVKVVDNAAGPPNSPSNFIVGPHTFLVNGNSEYSFSGTGAMAHIAATTTGFNFGKIGATTFTGQQTFDCSVSGSPCMRSTPPDNTAGTKFWYWTNAANSAYTAWINDDGSIGTTGTLSVGNASQTLYRCTTAGTLPVGALTTVTGNCGASVDTGLRGN